MVGEAFDVGCPRGNHQVSVQKKFPSSGRPQTSAKFGVTTLAKGRRGPAIISIAHARKVAASFRASFWPSNADGRRCADCCCTECCGAGLSPLVLERTPARHVSRGQVARRCGDHPCREHAAPPSRRAASRRSGSGYNRFGDCGSDRRLSGVRC